MSEKGNGKTRKEKMGVSRRVSESGEDLCPVCSELVTFYAVGKCDHFVCYRCSTRMRSLCDQMYCAICRTELPKVVFIRTLKKFEEIDTYHFLVNRKVKVHFENDTIQEAFNDLLEHRCPLCPGRKPFRVFPNLKDHMRKDHNLHYCDLCINNLKIFTHERRYYDRKKLAEHRRVGDADDKSHKGHPLCKFCDERFLDNDELVRHLRKEHYFCHFCDADGISNQFYSDYPVLREHFSEAHYMCDEEECAYAQFTNAFRTEIDLKAHKATEHGKGMRKSQQKQVRAVDIDINLVPRAGATRRYDRAGNKHQYQRRDDHYQRRDDQYQRRDDHCQRRDDAPGAVISGADYEEVSQDSERRVGYQPRTKRQQRQVDREAEETARAITASLADMQRTGHVNVVDEALVRPVTSVDQKKGEKYTESSGDFPTLDGKVIHDDRTSDDDVASGKDPGKAGRKDTMAKKVARANMFSVAEGDLSTDDFPSLGRGAPGHQPIPVPLRNTSAPKPAQPQQKPPPVMDDFPALGGGSTKAPVPQSIAGMSAMPMRTTSAQPPPQRQAPVVDDFPALGGGSKPRQGFPLKQNTWVSSTPTASASSKKPSQKPTQSKAAQQKSTQNKSQSQPKTSSYQDYPTLGSIGGSLTKTLHSKGTAEELLASAPVPSSQSMTSNIRIIKAVNDDPPSLSNVASIVNKPVNMSEGDFPSLGNKNSGKGSVQWGPKPKQPEREEKQEKPDKQEGQYIAKLKNKNKKKNKGNIDDIDSGSAQGSDSEIKKASKGEAKKTSKSSTELKPKEDSSDFDFEIHSEKTEPVPKESEKVTSGKSKKKKVKETKENKSSNVSSTTAAKEPSSKSEPQVPDAKVPAPKLTELQSSDDFPSLSALKDQSNLPSKVADLKLDDFPVLSGSLVPPPGVAPPPPGLSKPAGPPGFGFSPVSSLSSTAKPTPPPGFGSLGNFITQVKVEPEEMPEPEPSGGNGEPRFYEYTPPPNFMERNHRLIAAIQRHVKEDETKFNEFKSCSGQFRTEKMGPYDYYDRCSIVIGKDNFRMIFPELLVLLPDISKQQELLKAHNAAMRLSQGKKSQVKSKKKAMWSNGEHTPFVSCSTCNQVILQRDFSDHLKGHNLESDFPSLGSTTTSGSGHGLSAWVRAK